MAERAAGWSPRLWEGLDYFAFLRLMVRARGRVGPRHVYIVLIMAWVTFANMVLGWLQQARWGRRIARTPLPTDPIFVLGHWRAGTTLLHELLLHDPRFTAPSTLDCFLPCHSLVSGPIVRRWLAFLLPSKRPMDNMPAGWDRPQEDEFALALLGQPSTYSDLAFPNDPPLDPGALDLSGLTAPQRARWRRTLARFVRTLAARDPRTLVLKSPPHTARIPDLLAIFPNARFIHIRRHPLELFLSTRKLWHALSTAHGLQTPPPMEHFDDKVFREFEILHKRYFATRALIPAGRLVEVRFEKLTTSLVDEMAHIYNVLDLGGFEIVRPELERYAAAQAGYERNRFPLDPVVAAQVQARWGAWFDRLGYS